MTKTILNTNLALFVSQLKENFTVNFIKKDGSERTMACNVEGTGYGLVNDLDQPYLLVNSIFDKGLRSVNVDTVRGILVGDTEYAIV